MITRNTMRADGLTVGEAMDQDAKFLRSVGVPALAGQKTSDERREAFKEAMRDAVLKAVDTVTSKEFNAPDQGWIDAELAALFPAVDNHSQAVFSRLS